MKEKIGGDGRRFPTFLPCLSALSTRTRKSRRPLIRPREPRDYPVRASDARRNVSNVQEFIIVTYTRSGNLRYIARARISSRERRTFDTAVRTLRERPNR